MTFKLHLLEAASEEKLKHLEHAEDHIMNAGMEGFAHAYHNLEDVHDQLQGKKNKTDKRPVKEKVFEYVTTTHPDFPWKRHVAKTGNQKGKEIYSPECKDMSDAYVIAVGGKRLTKQG